MTWTSDILQGAEMVATLHTTDANGFLKNVSVIVDSNAPARKIVEDLYSFSGGNTATDHVVITFARKQSA